MWIQCLTFVYTHYRFNSSLNPTSLSRSTQESGLSHEKKKKEEKKEEMTKAKTGKQKPESKSRKAKAT